MTEEKRTSRAAKWSIAAFLLLPVASGAFLFAGRMQRGLAMTCAFVTAALVLGCLLVGVIGLFKAWSEVRRDPNVGRGAPIVASILAASFGMFGALVWALVAMMAANPMGRPLRVGGKPTRARRRPEGHAGWSAPIDPAITPNELTAQRWLRDAHLEHASIAAFASLANDLLALGAPASLIRGAHEAALDEIEHARVSFRIASLYAGRPLGPGDYPEARAPRPRRTRDQLLIEVAIESALDGWIGEGVAARIAAEASEREGDPIVREVLASIARDEARHAELGRAVLEFCLDEGASLDVVISAIRARAIDGETRDRALEQLASRRSPVLSGERAG
jgi:hypothetical protein